MQTVGCNHIRRIIDEAERPEAIPLEAARHTVDCGDCRTFANERALLRELLASASRVTVPINFEAALSERLAGVSALGGSLSSWFGQVSYLRMGTAAAGLAIVVFAVQFSGVFVGKQNLDTGSAASTSTGSIANVAGGATTPGNPGGSQIVGSGASIATGGVRPLVVRQVNSNNRRSAAFSTTAVAAVPVSVVSDTDGPVVLLKSRTGQREIPMLPVSIGAQQLLYSNSNRPVIRSAGIAF